MQPCRQSTPRRKAQLKEARLREFSLAQLQLSRDSVADSWTGRLAATARTCALRAHARWSVVERACFGRPEQLHSARARAATRAAQRAMSCVQLESSVESSDKLVLPDLYAGEQGAKMRCNFAPITQCQKDPDLCDAKLHECYKCGSAGLHHHLCATNENTRHAAAGDPNGAAAAAFVLVALACMKKAVAQIWTM
eukprot:6180614-Pleurochrysis_carterae.AAC.1